MYCNEDCELIWNQLTSLNIPFTHANTQFFTTCAYYFGDNVKFTYTEYLDYLPLQDIIKFANQILNDAKKFNLPIITHRPRIEIQWGHFDMFYLKNKHIGHANGELLGNFFYCNDIIIEDIIDVIQL